MDLSGIGHVRLKGGNIAWIDCEINAYQSVIAQAHSIVVSDPNNRIQVIVNGKDVALVVHQYGLDGPEFLPEHLRNGNIIFDTHPAEDSQ